MAPSPPTSSPDPGPAWRLPVVPEGFDRTPVLSPEERAALAVYRSVGSVASAHWAGTLESARRALVRLTDPLDAIHALTGMERGAFTAARRILYAEMRRRDAPYWAWDAAAWQETCTASPGAFARRYGPSRGRVHLLVLAYLLGGERDLRPFGLSQNAVMVARAIFGRERVEAATARVADGLYGRAGLGYLGERHKRWHVRWALCQALLLNQSPNLEALPLALLERMVAESAGAARDYVRQLGRALGALGLLVWTDPVRDDRARHVGDAGVPPHWAAWCRAWSDRQAPRAGRRRQDVLHSLYAVGRWLRDTHPAVETPDQWDEDVALAYVDYLCTTARVGDDVSPGARVDLAARGALGKPFSARHIAHRLCDLRGAFCAWQDRPHAVDGAPARTIPIRFKPQQALATPRAVSALIRPDPRDIELGAWYKLAYAAATLRAEDLAAHGRQFYPAALYRAMALLWITTARRPGELRRLPVGCVRREWEPSMLGEDGKPLDRASQELCYLRVPTNKTGGAFWIWIPTYTADAVEAWERERAVGQAARIDAKDREAVDYLFLVRNRMLSVRFLNTFLIPVLCALAGVPERDARGQLTAHRGRSTRATLLRKLGVPLADIAAYLGHTDERMVRHYARTDDLQLALTIKRADEKSRLVEGLIDVPAAQEGRPNVFFFLGKGPEGKPRYCGNPAWASCPHRLACLKCRMYVGGDAAEVLEAREGVLRFQTQVPMTPVEQAAADGDAARLRERLAELQGLPVPEPPAAAFVFNTTAPEPLPAPQPTSDADRRPTPVERLAGVQRDLATARELGKRSVLVKALERQVVMLEAEVAALAGTEAATRPSPGAATAREPGS